MKYLSLNIKYLKEKENLSEEDFGKKFGLNRGAIQSYISDKAKPKLETLQKLSEMYHISIDDLLNIDISVSNDKNLVLESENQVYINGNGKGVPYFDIDISATITESFNDVKEIPEFYVDFKPFNDCAAYLPIWGDSMYPTFASGEIIAVKKLLNKNIILWGEAHLIITNEVANNMKTIKLLYPHDDEDKIILRASNPNFKGDTVIPKSSILSIYIVKGKITRKQL